MTQTIAAPTSQPAGKGLAAPLAPSAAHRPAIILGGGANALSVARNIARIGARVYSLNEVGALIGYSRYCTRIDLPADRNSDDATAWADWLLSDNAGALAGSVLLACSDAGIECICDHRDALSRRYVLDDCNPPAQRAMLNKLETYRLAAEAGVPTPKFWEADSFDQLCDLREQLVYPMIVKPRLSHVFEGQTGKKLLTARNFDEVVAAVKSVCETGTGCVLMELIPGPDDRLCSYFTYLDEQSRPLLHFTKRVIRRYPEMTGAACYHITDWNPELVELATQLFRHVGLRGVANVEFKRDDRDGKLKLIECNARFVGSDRLAARSGVDLAGLVYRRLTGLLPVVMKPYQRGMRMWDPVRDFQAHRALKRSGRSTFIGWLKSVLHRQTFPYFCWSDPMPAIVRLTNPLRRKFASKEKRGEAR